MKTRIPELISSRRGVALPFIALLLFVFLGMAALAVDVGILLGARTEAQRTADAAALAGATILLADGQNEALARSTAIDWAARNLIRNESVVVEPGDVDVELQNGLVRVRVYRTAARGSAVPNIFARAIGFPSSDVSTWAAAVAGAGNAIRCPLPFALVDRFWDTSAGQLSGWTDAIDRNNDIYNQGARDNNPAPPTGRTGWSNLDIGQIWRIYPEGPQGTPTPGYYYPLALDSPGGNAYRNWIRGCGNRNTQFVIGQDIDIEPGAMTGPTNQGFGDMLDGDNSEWSFARNCPVAHAGATECLGPSETGRIRPILIISPFENALTQSGRQTVRIVNLAGVFVVCNGTLNAGVTPQNLVRKSQCTPNNGNNNPPDAGVWVRFMGIQGEIGPGPDPNSNSLIRVLRLVE
jgi:Flp pilus assembly protein TadG